MKRSILILLATALFSCNKDESGPINTAIPLIKKLPVPEHIIFLWLENKGYSQIMNSGTAPYIDSLAKEGTLFTNFHALGHPSYPEYISFFAGTNNGKKDDNCLTGIPYSNANLYTQLAARGKTFAWYSEDLPQRKDECISGKYVERHNPTQAFSNVPLSADKSWDEFPRNFTSLENVVCISPNLDHDMHDGSIAEGEKWMRENVDDLIKWCKTHNSVFVIYYDEDNGTSANRIPVIALGKPIRANAEVNALYDHYDMTRTILEIYGAEQIANSASATTITDCWAE